jgi:hypothetical protein
MANLKERNRSNVESIPMGTMEITLPIAVQTDPQTISYKIGKNSEGVIVLNCQPSIQCTLKIKQYLTFHLQISKFPFVFLFLCTNKK